MARKRKKRNPATQKIIDKEVAKERELLLDYLNHKIKTITEIDGIGEKTRKKISNHFGGTYDEQQKQV